MFTEQQLQEFHTQLVQMRNDLIETIHSELEDEESPFNVTGDIADKAEAITYVSVNEELTAGQKNTLDKIDRAIKRIEDKIFGKCSVCSKPIELDRLTAIPYAETCKEHMQ